MTRTESGSPRCTCGGGRTCAVAVDGRPVRVALTVPVSRVAVLDVLAALEAALST